VTLIFILIIVIIAKEPMLGFSKTMRPFICLTTPPHPPPLHPNFLLLIQNERFVVILFFILIIAREPMLGFSKTM
jgi:hypothetical protein